MDSCSDEHDALALITEIAKYGAAVTYLRSDVPGVSLARNLGIDSGSSDWIAFLDDDTIVDAAYFDRLMDRLHLVEDDIGTIGGQLVGQLHDGEALPNLGPRWRSLLSLSELQQDTDNPHFPAIGANVVYRRAALPDERFLTTLSRVGTTTLMGGEDTRLERAMHAKGYRSFFDSRILAHHRIKPERLTPSWVHRRAFAGGFSEVLCIDRTIQSVPLGVSLPFALLKIGPLAVRALFDTRLLEWTIRRNYVWGVIWGHIAYARTAIFFQR